MTNKLTAHETLLAYYNTDRKMVEIEFNKEHYGATDYLELMAAADLGLEVGTRFKSNTGGANNRKIVGVVTPVGNVVFFERYTEGENGVVVVNLPHSMAGVIPTGMQKSEDIDRIMGGVKGLCSNIGEIMDNVIKTWVAERTVYSSSDVTLIAKLPMVVQVESRHPHLNSPRPYKLTELGGDKGVVVKVLPDTSSDVVLYDSPAFKRDFPRPEEVTAFAVPFERVRQLAARLPASEHNTRRVAVALDMYVSTDVANAIPRLDELFAKLEGMSQEEVAAWVSDTIVGHAKGLLDIGRHGRTRQAGDVEVRHEVHNPPVDDESN